VVGIAAVLHAIRRFDCVRASATTTAIVRWATSLVVLMESLIEGPQMCLLRRCPKILLPILRWAVAIRINVMHWLGVAALV
jgi:hypothetical protein